MPHTPRRLPGLALVIAAALAGAFVAAPAAEARPKSTPLYSPRPPKPPKAFSPGHRARGSVHTRVGNTTYGSGGSISQKVGRTSYRTDRHGRRQTCTRVAHKSYC